MAHLQPGGADDGEVVAGHQVVDGVHRSGGAVLDGQDAVLAHAGLHRLKHVLKGVEVENGGGFKNAVTGDLGIGPLDALTGHGGPLRKELRSGIQGPADGLIHLGLDAAALVLIGAARRQDGAEHRLGIVGQLLSRLRPHLGQQGPLPARVQGGQAMLLFIGRDVPGDGHPLLEQRYQLGVDGINFSPQLLQILTHRFLLLTYASNKGLNPVCIPVQQGVQQHQGGDRLHHRNRPGDNAGVVAAGDL